MKTYLLIGRTGVGKSSFINSAFGIQLANTDSFIACTAAVKHYAKAGSICLIDTPGFSEGQRDLDEKYLEMINDEVDLGNLYATLYFSRLDDTRFRAEDMQILRCITNALTASVWSNAWLILTFSGNVNSDELNKQAIERTHQITDYLAKLTIQLTRPYSFYGFKKILCVDNSKPYWAHQGMAIIDALSS